MTKFAEASVSELTLDPENWDELRRLGHRMLDDIFHNLQALREAPAWQPVPPGVRAALHEPLPQMAQGEEQVYCDFLDNVLPYTSGNRHPRAWGWVRGAGTPFAMLAEMLAAGINTHAAGGQQASTYIEQQVIQWMAQAMGMPQGTSGILTSGGTMANTLGLAVARHSRAGYDIREEGLQGNHPRLVVYGSTEIHMWARKGMELLGLGRSSLRQVPVDVDFRMNEEVLRKMIRDDREAGLRPIAVIGNAGTVNTGAVDDLAALAGICSAEDLWFHVDGAFGAMLKFTEKYSRLVDGIEHADSLAFDLHKWGSLPFEAGCLLVRDAKAHTATFATQASYLEPASRGMLSEAISFSDRGIEQSRSFKALKIWMTLKAYGTNLFGQIIEQNVEQAEYLESGISAHRELELLAPRSTNVVCFRYVSASRQEAAELDRINREIVLRLQESGDFIVSGTTLRGAYAIRVAHVNHRSRREDFDALTAAVLRHGRDIVGEKMLFGYNEPQF